MPQDGISLQTHLLQQLATPPDLLLSTRFIILRSQVTADLVSAHKVFDAMPQRSIVSWTAMISGYVQNGELEDAHQTFDKMEDKNVISLIISYGRHGYGEAIPD
ncbi:uncharacterized protein A4U43_C06F40 [Asparagus officinalis]|uniref:Pentatricopeptide repeat-containing protein n=1 Tax=Asparagus officinalis TaxID=4686 RepID=A0A5P1ENT7_ASPOF|nr:uncharacterized protein A4U43_C06F40 [Asparagus officinalis]